jgi:hypothetical protein
MSPVERVLIQSLYACGNFPFVSAYIRKGRCHTSQRELAPDFAGGLDDQPKFCNLIIDAQHVAFDG